MPARGAESYSFHGFVDRLSADFGGAVRNTDQISFQARDLVDRLAVSLQASLLIRHAPAAVADAYCASRIDSQGIHNSGALPVSVDARAIIERATPHV